MYVWDSTGATGTRKKESMFRLFGGGTVMKYVVFDKLGIVAKIGRTKMMAILRKRIAIGRGRDDDKLN